ncbi:hypothetical protein M0R04_00245 [Candidatus Dojkabacteria bacterium]|jgi:predicted RNA-binding protein with PUA domain|nr:hypothetical protein [Candidatus Dojkabacteria bacterium]
MKIGIIGSCDFLEEFKKISIELKKLGFEPYMSSYSEILSSKSQKEIEELKKKISGDSILEFWKLIQNGDAVLVLNYDKRGIKNYIGGSTLIEMAFAYVLGQKIFLLNPIPEIQYYYDEIIKMKPTILNGNLSLITNSQ